MASTTLVYIHYSLLPTALLFEQQHVKGASIVDHVTPPHGKMSGRSIPDDCERTATVALPTAASAGFISGELGTSAALDAFSTVYELLLTRFENRQTYGHEQSLYLALLAMPTRGNELTSQQGIVPLHTSPRIRKRELLPQPLGPHTSTFMPDLTSKSMSFTSTSPLGVTSGTLSNLHQHTYFSQGEQCTYIHACA